MDEDFAQAVFRDDQDWLVTLHQVQYPSKDLLTSGDGGGGVKKGKSYGQSVPSLNTEANQWRHVFSKALALRQEVYIYIPSLFLFTFYNNTRYLKICFLRFIFFVSLPSNTQVFDQYDDEV